MKTTLRRHKKENTEVYRQEWIYNEKQGIGRDGTRENQMKEIHMKIVHIKTIGEERGEG